MPDYITSDEFSRWTDQLSRRLDDHHGAIQGSLNRIDAHLEGINGRTRTNSEKISVLEREVQALESVDLEVSAQVDNLAKVGCAQYQAHTKILEQLVGLPAWTAQKKAAVAGGLVGTGALMWPAIQKVAEAVQTIVKHTP